MFPNGWREHNYVACCGVSIQPVLKMLERIPEQEAVYICLDNDEAGNRASMRMAEQLEAEGIMCVRIAPRLKDWNEDLSEQIQEQEASVQCQKMYCR